MAYSVSATNSNSPLASDKSGPFIAEELRAIKAYYLGKFSTIEASLQSLVIDSLGHINKAGDSMLGPLLLSRSPIDPSEAATKGYIDNLLDVLIGAISGTSLAASVFIGVRQSGLDIVYDVGEGSYILEDYAFYDFIPVTATLSIDVAGDLMLTF